RSSLIPGGWGRGRREVPIRGPRVPEGGAARSSGQGRDGGPSHPGLAGRLRGPGGEAHRADRGSRRRGASEGPGRGHGRPVPVEPGDRGLPDPGTGGRHVTPRVAVVTFPGSLDDRDALRAVRSMGGEPVSVWHADVGLQDSDAVILPGGFSYGDYLRTGAIARFA